MLSRVLILMLMSFSLLACGGGGGGGGTDVPDGAAPSAPGTPDLAAASDTGVSATDNITSDNTPTFIGSGGVAGHVVTLYANGIEVGSATVAGNGSWSVTSSVLADNSYSITARYTDADDNQSVASPALTPVVIDTLAPSAPAMPDLLASSDTGESDSDNITSDNTPTFVGSGGVAGHTVTVYANAVAVGSALVSAGGSWSVTSSVLADDSYSITARYTDIAGNQSADSDALNPVQINTTSLSAPAAPDLDAASDTGVSDSDNITSDNTPTFIGTGGTAGDTVTAFANGSQIGTGTVAGDGSWSVTSSMLADDSYSITVRYTSLAGNQSDASAALEPLIIDTQAPAAPVVSVESASGISGTAGAGETITLYDDSAAIVASTGTDESGQWSIAASELPGGSGHGFSGQVSATDLAGNESLTSSVGPIDDPAPTLVTGRIAGAVMKDADVCASVFDGNWIPLGCTISDEEGYFGFDIAPQDGPVLVEIAATVNTRGICAAPAGCGDAGFADEYDVQPGATLQLLIPGDRFSGELAVTPLTHMAASWAMKVPGPLDNNVVALSLTRVADLFALEEDFFSRLLPDITNAAELNDAAADALSHAILAAGFAQLAATDAVDAAALTDQAALMFAWLGGQVWLQSGQIVLDDLAAGIDLSAYPELAQWLSTIDYEAYPDLLALADEYNVISYIGFDNLISAGSEVAAHLAVADDFSALVSRWGDNYVTTMAGATGFDAAAFAEATGLLDRFEHYRALSAAADAELDPVTRHLAWLYADATSRERTIGMLKVVLEAVQFSLDGSICVPQRKNLQSCNVEPPYADLKNVGTLINPSYRVELRGARYGQTVNINLPSTDIRTFLQGGTMTMPVTGTITNGTSVTTLNINIDLDITNNDLSGFQAMGNLDFANSSLLDPLLEQLLADLHIKVTVRGSGSVASTSPAIGSYSFSNLNTSLTFNRRVLTQGENGPVLTARLNTGSRTNPAGELLASIVGETAFDLVIDDPFSLDIAYLVQRAGLPPMQIRLSGDLEGTAPLVEALSNWIESNLDADIVLEEIDFDALLAELDFSLLALDGSASLTILDGELGQQQYHFSISDGGFNVSTLAGAEPVLSLRVSGLAGYLYSGDTLISTVHIGNQGQGVVLSLVNDSQRFYSSLDSGAMLPFDSLLEFLTLLYETFAPAEEPAP
jgi:hypothetical protein